MNNTFCRLLDPNNNDEPIVGTSVLTFCTNWDRESDYNPSDPDTLLFKININPQIGASIGQFRLRKQFDPTRELDNIIHLKILIIEGATRVFEFRNQFRPQQFRRPVEIDVGLGKLSS